MRKPLRLLAALLALCVTATLFPPVGLAAGTIHHLKNEGILSELVASNDVKDGDTIILEGHGNVVDVSVPSSDIPWVINKNLTIQGAEGASASITSYSGIVLGDNVTFRNLAINFPSLVYTDIAANGYTLTLDEVTCSNQPFSLFCGSLTGSPYLSLPSAGPKGQIIIKGKTSLKSSKQCGDIYAGNLYWGNPENATADAPEHLNGDVDISVPSTSVESDALGTIYACGATRGNSSVHEPEYIDSTVTGTVTISGNVPDVQGTGGGTVDVTYSGGSYPADRTFSNISNLTVEQGSLVLEGASSFRGANTISVRSGARLSVVNMTDPSFCDFNGGGYLILGQSQTLNITGSVTGTSKVAVGRVGSNDTCGKNPLLNHVYIQAPSSSDKSFELLPTNTVTPIVLEYASDGSWTAVSSGGTGGTDEKVASFAFKSPETRVGAEGVNKETAMLLNVEYIGDQNTIDLSNILLDIKVNGETATLDPNSDDYGYNVYTTDNLTSIAVVYSNNGDAFYATPTAEGTYNISITIPGEYTQSGQPLTASAKLIVGTPGPTSIPVPQAVTGLKWTGQSLTGVEPGEGYSLSGNTAVAVGNYTATATLNPDYQWADGTNTEKQIDWAILRADGPAAPGGLSGIAPTSASGTDGRITGVSSLMEYSAQPNFTNPQPCAGSEITGLAAGTYYVRLAQTATHEAGAAATVAVPAFGVTAEAISVNSTNHKTAYHVGDSLDVTNLTILVRYSDQSTNTVPVTEKMVSGFNASAPAASQTLTIEYEGLRTTYVISITEVPVVAAYQVTVNNSHAPTTGAGRYEAGQQVTVHAGTQAGYDFASWSETGVTLTEAQKKNPDLTFQMPANDVVLLAIWSPNGSPGHIHDWSKTWSSNASHHWHNCAAPDCTLTENAQKDGYAAHTPGAWVVDKAATATQSGSRHKACTVCGYVTERGTIPATGGSSGGSSSSSSDNSSSNSDSFFGTNSGGNGGSAAKPEKNPDGSTTTTTTNKTTGTMTETTKWADGSQRVVETKQDGTVTSTEKTADGSVTKTVEKPDGTWETTVTQTGGLTASLRGDPAKGVSADVKLPSKVVQETQSGGGTVVLPIPELPVSATVTLHTGSVRPVRVELPVGSSAPGVVALLVGPDGSETVIKTAVLTGNRMTLSVTDGATLTLRDNRKNFSDTRGHWAGDAIDFVSARDLFSGKTSASFAPDVPMTRAMLMTVLARLDGTEAAGGSAYQTGMAWAVARGVSDGSNPDAPITREQLVAMLHRYAGSPAATNRELHFSDAGAVSDYAAEAVRWATENGILGGYRDGSLVPGGQATRAQVATMLMRYVSDLNP